MPTITQALGERVRDAKEVGAKISLSLPPEEVTLLHRLGIIAEAALAPGDLYTPGPNFLLFCSVAFAERVKDLNDRIARDGGVRGVARITEILTEIDHLADEEEGDEDADEDEEEGDAFFK
jgi:hypothetical protein